MNKKTELIYSSGIFLFFFTVFILSIPEVLSVAHDSIQYITEIEKGINIYNPHHLFFAPFSKIWLDVSALAGIKDGVFAFGILNSFFSAAGLLFIFKILTTVFQLRNVRSALITSIIAFNYGYWFYSVCVEIYLIPLSFVLAGIYYLFNSFQNKKHFYLSSILFAVAVLFHQSHILFSIPVLVFFFINKHRIGIKKIIIYVLIYSAIIAAGYFYVIFAVKKIYSFDGILYWLTYYTHVIPSWNTTDSSALFKVIIGFGRSFITTQTFLVSPETADLIKDLFSQKSLEDDKFLLRNLSKGMIWLYISIILFLIISIFSLTISVFKNIKQNFDNNILVIISALLVYSIFFSFWNPENLEFWIPQNIFFWMIIAVLSKKNKVFQLILTLAAFAFLNWFFLISKTQNINNDFYYNKVKTVNQQSSNNDAILLENKWIYYYYFDRFSNLQKFSIQDEIKDGNEHKLNKILDKHLNNNNSVFMLEDLLKKNNNLKFLKAKRIKTDTLKYEHFNLFYLKY